MKHALQDGLCAVTSTTRDELQDLISVDLDFAEDLPQQDTDSDSGSEGIDDDEPDYGPQSSIDARVPTEPRHLSRRSEIPQASPKRLPPQRSLTASQILSRIADPDKSSRKLAAIGSLNKRQVRRGVLHRPTPMHNQMKKLVTESFHDRSVHQLCWDSKAAFSRGPGSILGSLALDLDKPARCRETIIGETDVQALFVSHDALRKYFKVCHDVLTFVLQY